jgi:alpha-methylacyl-CoA racemase
MAGGGPLSGIRVIEISGIGPIPLAGTLLSDLGAQVTRVDRPADVRAATADAGLDVLSRGRTAVVIDLRQPAGVERLLGMVAESDVLIEGLRPGVMERLGVGPDDCLRRNPRLIYGRMTGWGQAGPLRDRAGHDINYLALSGALHAMGYGDRPPSPPLNLVADYGGGTMLLAFGVACALVERERSGLGQVIDAAMVDGVTSLAALFHSWVGHGDWRPARESNLLDGGAHFYRVYETADHRFLAVGAIEPQFYAELLARLGLDAAGWPQDDAGRWPELRERLADIFRGRRLADWVQVFEGSDACVTAVNTFEEAQRDPHLLARETLVTEFGLVQPAPAPRFSRTPGKIAGPPVVST